MKVLHIVESLNRGAVENWLVRMLRHGVQSGAALDWTFYCILQEKGQLEDMAVSLGARVIHSPVPISRKLAFMRALRAELRHGHYDVIHCHHDLISAVYLIASVGLPTRKRIVHIHNADEEVLTPGMVKQRMFRPTFRRICLMMADNIIGISNHTLDTFLSGRGRRPGRDLVHYYGVDASAFVDASALDRVAFRRELGLADDSCIFLFAGRLVPEKNPVFAMDVFAELHRREPSAVAIFAGSGSLEGAVSERARALGLQQQVRLLGWRNDLPAIMRCCDLFILPRPESPMEGFGLAVVEAQLAGLKLLLSNGIADDPLLPTAVYRRLALSAGPAAWAAAALDLLREPSSCCAGLAALAKSPCNIDFAFRDLMMLYGASI